MQPRAICKRRNAFTLIELLVVMAIVALLITLLVPAFRKIQGDAYSTKTRSQFNALDQGLEMYRAESALGGEYPPSRTDFASDNRNVSNPKSTAAVTTPDTRVSGAHLLVHAMLGADLLGTPGFKDVNKDGYWANDTHAGTGGLYEIYQSGDKAGQAVRPRYGGAGYVSDNMRDRVTTLKALREKGTISQLPDIAGLANTLEQPLFADNWDRPILYYRASRAAQLMVTSVDGGSPGVYRQADNSVLTGSNVSGASEKGVDFGRGEVASGLFHAIGRSVNAPPIPQLSNGVNTILTDASFDNSFTRFILDTGVTTRNTPVRKDSYLLISAGDDGVYGTSDDITNWQRVEP